MVERNRFLEAAIEAALQAGRLQRFRFAGDVSIALKGDKNLVTEIDQESERIIVDHLRPRFSSHMILAEENEYSGVSSPYCWVIDPLDGTTNYAHGFPWFCVSIALEHQGEPIVGVIHNPMTNELFTATKGGGAFLNGVPLRVSSRSPLSGALLGTGFPYDCATDPDNNFAPFMALQKRARGIRRAGAAALDLAYVAAGRLDGFWELKLKPWDVSVGTLLVREAGGMVTAFDGSPYQTTNHRIVASNGLIHNEIIEVLATLQPGVAP